MVLRECIIYYSNGNLRRHFFVDERNIRQDCEYRYYYSGIVSFKGRFENGLIHGERITFHRDGRKMTHDVFIHGLYLSPYSALSERDRFEISLKERIEWF